MKAKHLSLAVAALLAAGGLWLARSAWRTHAFQKSSMAEMSRDKASAPSSMLNDSRPVGGPDAGRENSNPSSPRPGQMLNPPARLAPPVPNRRFTDFTPEQRVQFARQGHGPGG